MPADDSILTPGETSDERFVRRALELAVRHSCGRTRPNPPVGAVVVKDDVIIGSGYHAVCGGDHAEVAALKSCKESTEGATVYCTLEPCSKPGRVGACCAALIEAKVRRVVWACADPNPTNAGCAMKVLRAACIECKCLAESEKTPLKTLAHEVWHYTLRAFAKHVTTGLPFVEVKLAMSLDGRICDKYGASQWISDMAARERTGDWRANVDVMMVGAETVRKDNPSLLCHTDRQHNEDLWRAVVSRSGNLPPDAQIFTDEARDRTLVYRDVVEAVTDLGKRGFLHVLCEGGLDLARSLAAANLVDAWTSIVCPIVIGDKPMDEALHFSCTQSTVIGNDTFVEGRLKISNQ